MIEVSESGGIAVLRMAHGKANALDIELCAEIVERFEQCRKSGAGAVVLTGTGAIFSAGVDLVRLLQDGPPYVRRFLPELSRAFEAVFLHPRPVVIAINGHAIAGGCVLACCGDRRLMARGGGKVGVTELLVGVPLPARAFEIMRSVAASRFFHEVITSGATYTQALAIERGLVDEVVEPDALIDRAIDVARQLAAISSAAFALTKRQNRQPVLDRLERHGGEVDAAVEQIWVAPETTARIREYVSRTLKKS